MRSAHFPLINAPITPPMNAAPGRKKGKKNNKIDWQCTIFFSFIFSLQDLNRESPLGEADSVIHLMNSKPLDSIIH